MACLPFSMILALAYLLLTSSIAFGQTTTSSATSAGQSTTINGTPTSFRSLFTVPPTVDQGFPLIPNIQDPQAVDAQTVCPGYTASNVKKDDYGFSATLSLAGKPCNLYGTDITTLSLTVQYQSADRLSINIQPAYVDAKNISQYILGQEIYRPTLDSDAKSTTGNNDFQISWSNEPTFSFKVTRKSTGDVVFDTSGSVLVYENQFIEFVSKLPDNYNLYGLGERIHGLRLGNNFTATIYAADVGDPIDYNLYGSHPFYLDTRYYEKDSKTGKSTLVTSNETKSDSQYVSYSHGVYLRNAHGQDVLLRPHNITWRTLGGSIDLYFFDGPTQHDVTQQYQVGAIGLPAMQSYWTFGYHQCRWGYQNWTQLQEVVDNFKNYGIPLETIWTDIDYMNQYRDFSVNPWSFPLAAGQAFLSRLHSRGQHFIPIVDSAIYIPNPMNASDAYDTYNRGNKSGAFMLNPDGSTYIGIVWPGYTVFPDWRAQDAVAWWVNEMTIWHRDIAFDGIWIDMSEVSSFCVGSCGTGNVSMNPVHVPFKLPGEPGSLQLEYPEGFNLTNATEASIVSSISVSQSLALASSTATATATASSTSSESSSSSTSTSYYRTTPTPGVRDVNHPPYVINHVNGDLAIHAISPNATHHDGVQEYDVHNLWGHQILNATYQALLNVFPGKRPFIIGRSTFAGSGKWAGHWGGDNASKWYHMFFSIPQALSFSLFGIPMFGPDTCGFNGNTDEELCNRWMQLSAFFPFYRNHNVLSTISQEPYIWASVTAATKTAMSIRYALLPYMYTLFHLSHTTGSTVMRALAWEFPNDPSLAAADRQFLLGPSLLITPVLEQGAKSVQGVFPGVADGEVWYDWYNQTAVMAGPRENVTIAAPLGHIPVYVRGGSVLPMQLPGYTTAECRQNPWALLVALSAKGEAAGQLYVDDGESLKPDATLSVGFAAAAGGLRVTAKGKYQVKQPLSSVTVMGVAKKPGSVSLDGMALGGGVDWSDGVLKVTGLEKATSGGAWSRDWVLSWA